MIVLQLFFFFEMSEKSILSRYEFTLYISAADGFNFEWAHECSTCQFDDQSSKRSRKQFDINESSDSIEHIINN